MSKQSSVISHHSSDNNKNISPEKSERSSLTMADLMASLDRRHITFSRGETASGKITLISDNEIVVDLGVKAEGVLNKRDFLPEQLRELKVGSKIEAYVLVPENESGQVVLSLFRAVQGGKRAEEQAKKWQKFITAQQRQTTLMGKVVEVNKGGLLVEVEKVRGFVPSSQVSLKCIHQFTGDLVGRELKLKVIEIDPGNNRLVLTAKTELSEDEKKKFSEVQVGDKVSGGVVVIAPFGLFVGIDGLEGIVFTQELAWTEDKKPELKVGDKIEAKVTGKDENLGRLNLSLRQIQEDPFVSLAENFQIDDVVKGMVKEITQNGVVVTLDDGVEGLVSTSKVGQGKPYAVGQTTNFLVDSVDKARRRVNLAPFLTSTVGLIYK